MNTKFILFNLQEALEELDSTIKQIEGDSDYEELELSVAMSHLYHHVNTAWNARNSTNEESMEGSDEDFNRWGRYPSDLEVMSVD